MRVWSLFMVEGLGLTVKGLEFRMQGLGCRNFGRPGRRPSPGAPLSASRQTPRAGGSLSCLTAGATSGTSAREPRPLHSTINMKGHNVLLSVNPKKLPATIAAAERVDGKERGEEGGREKMRRSARSPNAQPVKRQNPRRA